MNQKNKTSAYYVRRNSKKCSLPSCNKKNKLKICDYLGNRFCSRKCYSEFYKLELNLKPEFNSNFRERP